MKTVIFICVAFSVVLMLVPQPVLSQEGSAAVVNLSDIRWTKALVRQPTGRKEVVTLVFLFDPAVFGWQLEADDLARVAFRHRYDSFEIWAVPTVAVANEEELEQAAIAWQLKYPVLPGALPDAYKPASATACLVFSHEGTLLKECAKAKDAASVVRRAIDEAPHAILGSDESIYSELASELQMIRKTDKLGRVVDLLQKTVADEPTSPRGEQAAVLLEAMSLFYEFHRESSAASKKYSQLDAEESYKSLAQLFKGCAWGDECRALAEEIGDSEDYKCEALGRSRSEEVRKGLLATDLKRPILKKIVALYEASRNIMIDFALTEADRACYVYLAQLKTWLTTLAGLAEDDGGSVVITEDGQVIINGGGGGGGKGGGYDDGGGGGGGGGGK